MRDPALQWDRTTSLIVEKAGTSGCWYSRRWARNDGLNLHPMSKNFASAKPHLCLMNLSCYKILFIKYLQSLVSQMTAPIPSPDGAEECRVRMATKDLRIYMPADRFARLCRAIGQTFQFRSRVSISASRKRRCFKCPFLSSVVGCAATPTQQQQPLPPATV